MTRFARGGQANKKKPNEASSWAEMKADMAAAAAARKDPSSKAPSRGGGGGGSSSGKVITRLKNGQYAVRIGGYEKILRTEAELRRWKRAGSERRRIQRKQRREETRVCFLCRQPGHLVGDCPEAAATADDAGGGGAVCFRCGSRDHALAACPKMPRVGGGGGDGQESAAPPDLPFASCFVCGRSGHLSRACPDNPRGLYPRGGGCLLCASVEHLRRDCPMAQKRRAAEADEHAVALPTAAAGVDDEVPLLPSRHEAAGGDDDSAGVGGSGGGGGAAKKRRTRKVKVVVL